MTTTGQRYRPWAWFFGGVAGIAMVHCSAGRATSEVPTAATGPSPAPSGSNANDVASSSAGVSGSSTTVTVTTHTPGTPEEQTKHTERCAKDDLAGCHAAALDLYYQPADDARDPRMFGLFKKACDLGYAPSCNGLGTLYASGRGTTKDSAKAAQLYRDACNAGASTACEHLADALRRGVGVTQDTNAADTAKQRAKCVFEASLKDKGFGACPALK